jgi:hypothetical protein
VTRDLTRGLSGPLTVCGSLVVLVVWALAAGKPRRRWLRRTSSSIAAAALAAVVAIAGLRFGGLR